MAHNVIIPGPTGAGKTYLACALGMAASLSFYSVRYIRLPNLLVDISVARDMLELVEARNNLASTILCSKYNTSEWHENLYNPTLADAICGPIIHNAYTIQIEGKSMRKRKGIPE